MANRPPNDQSDRLKKLAELRSQNVLSDKEFARARARLLASEAGAGPGSSQRGIVPFVRKHWPAFTGLGILLVLVVALVVFGRIAASDDTTNIALPDTNESVADVLDVGTAVGEEMCKSEDVHRRIKDQIFDQAVKAAGANATLLSSLRRAVGVRMDYPFFRGIDDASQRTDCSGRLIIEVPPTARAAFDGAASLEADLDYSVPASGSGVPGTIAFRGADAMIEQLVAAAGKVGEARNDASPDDGSEGTGEGPSFRCADDLSDVERMICGDEQLARLDRSISKRYVDLRSRLAGPDLHNMTQSQQQFLQFRARCRDVDCIRDAYVAQGRTLDRYAEPLGE